MTDYPPIVLPPSGHPAWLRAKQIVDALRVAGKANPFIVAAVANAYAESSWLPVIAGDKGKSFGPWQINQGYFGETILEATGIDIRTETSLAKQTQALLFLLSTPPFAKTLAALDAAKTGAEATAIFVTQFERAGAAGAVERRVAIAPAIEVWLSKQS